MRGAHTAQAGLRSDVTFCPAVPRFPRALSGGNAALSEPSSVGAPQGCMLPQALRADSEAGAGRGPPRTASSLEVSEFWADLQSGAGRSPESGQTKLSCQPLGHAFLPAHKLTALVADRAGP